MANKLADESSPYLLQHKDNPVDWYPWGPEAFARAAAENRPIFLSIGYAACHWCHVMAHESFEDETIAAQMNELFVNVKIDREERPDVDAIYMSAIQIMGEGGGWPLSAFCDATGRPYFLGTYFPPEPRFGRPSFPQLLDAMSKVYSEQRDKVAENTAAIVDGLQRVDEHYRRGAIDADLGKVEDKLLITAGRWLAQRSDAHHGGLGSKPKFPSSSSHDLMGRTGRLKFGAPSREAFLLQCQKMARGGIYDHVGGGFSRYSVDEMWLVPHFEKMLYDNGQLLSIYGDAYAMTGDAEYARVIDETVTWLEREMVHEPSGAPSTSSGRGLYSSQDADSEGEEGKYYVWTPAEVSAAVGPVDAILFNDAYGVTDAGNFEETGATVLSRVTDLGGESDEAALADMRARMYEVRNERVHPDTDTKVLSGWNGLAVSGLVRAYEATGNERALALATSVGAFLAETMVYADGTRLWRVFKDGTTKLEGTVDDYAFCAAAFFDLAEVHGDEAWWKRGSALLDVVLDRFYTERDGVGIFFMTPADADDLLIHRPESHHDGAIPSGASVATECLVRRGLMAGDERGLKVAETYLAGRAPQAAGNVFAGSRLLGAVDWYLNAAEVVVTNGAGRDELLTAARRAYAPTMMIAGPWASPSILDGKSDSPDGAAQAYVCRGQSCSAPVSDPAALLGLLAPQPS
jgi:hypothetical protein